ncbi:putative NADPH2 dehydrogenase chain OYE2 [Multifurca ochricompacta]|uniref:NADPH2 dehydrogenase chain OYE2 n=1 Tax=Multifurca ochricompacta TaxID=376703 RepID=A0AAD4M246_9AGAM|nr:putative NADPH2 dehydrogenase chain OYE2 [Multifurca ochricompacta]
MPSSVAPLFQPIRIGNLNVQHRIVMAPLTRFRANKAHVHGELAKTYYGQRAGVPGTLIVTEATFIAPQAAGYANVPGIWNADQIAGWKAVTETVHAKGSFIFLQLWSLGRTADPDVLKEEGSFDVIAPSPIPYIDEYAPVKKEPVVPRELKVSEIKDFAQLYSKAASNAIEAGFDGVELHSANGYLLDQFLQDVTNQRTDEYGGSVENRLRFPLEVINAVVKAVGAERTGIRLSPWSKFQGMGMEDPLPTFTTLVERIRDAHPNFAYIHAIEPRLNAFVKEGITKENQHETNDPLRKAWGDRPYIAAGGLERAEAIEIVKNEGGLVAFGRHFLANPDLPLRLKENVALTPYNRNTFYTPEAAAGYIDYPFSEQIASVKA